MTTLARTEWLTSRLEPWFTFSDYGSQADRSMRLAWASIGCFVLIDLIWLPASPLLFASSNWDLILRAGLPVVVIFPTLVIITHRLRDKTDRVGKFLRETTKRVELLWRALLPMSVLTLSAGTFTYLATSAAHPLGDAWLATMDRQLGFDWMGLLTFANSNPALSWMLVKAYHSTGIVLAGVFVWLTLTVRAERLAETIAIFCLSSLGVGIGMLLIPAAGAYTYYNPPHELFSNFSADAGMWHYKLFMTLRTDASPVIDLAKPEGLVTFPSFHTVLGIITTYALRDTRWIAIPALLLNGTMILATLPEGGHHLVDVIAGGAIAVISIAVVRLSCTRRTSSSAICYGIAT